MDDELATYKLQLQQVEAALLGDPNNEELLKLKTDLKEIIDIQEEISGKDDTTAEKPVSQHQVIHKWIVGERVIAPHPDGKKGYARIDSLTPAGIAITFTSTGQKTIVDQSDLQLPPENQRKNYAFDNAKPASSSNHHNKKEWQEERERRKIRALKKEQKRKEMDAVKDNEKKSWQKFNLKANAKGLKGLKRISATGSSKDGSSAYGVKRETVVSSRSNQFSFKATRGAMDSLF